MTKSVVWWDSVSVPTYYHRQSVGRVDRQGCFGRKYTGKCPTKMDPFTVCVSIWPPSAITQNSWLCVCVCVCVCAHFCANVWCLHLMFAQLINSGDAVLRWHIVQASLSPHLNQINSEYHLCTHWPPGQDLELRDAASFTTEVEEEQRLKIANLSQALSK